MTEIPNYDTLATEVAEALESLTGDTWKGTGASYGLTLIRGRDGLYLGLTAWTAPSRAEATYYPPEDRRGERHGEKLPRIGLSLKKGAAAIARDLSGRLIPDASELHDTLGQRAERTAEVRQGDRAVADRILALGWEEEHLSAGWIQLELKPDRFGTASGHATIVQGRANLTLNKLTRYQLERVLTALAAD